VLPFSGERLPIKHQDKETHSYSTCYLKRQEKSLLRRRLRKKGRGQVFDVPLRTEKRRLAIAPEQHSGAKKGFVRMGRGLELFESG